jgi:hypothetical protein
MQSSGGISVSFDLDRQAHTRKYARKKEASLTGYRKNGKVNFLLFTLSFFAALAIYCKNLC